MLQLTRHPDLARAAAARAADLFAQHRHGIFVRTDRLFAWLLLGEWVFGVLLALLISPRAWAGSASSVHAHVWAALGLGGAIVSLPVMLAFLRPGRTATRHVVAAAQMLMSALFIHLTGGRIETHFHVFGSLAFLAFYRDWRVFVPATLVVAVDHLLRGLFWPASVFGVLAAAPWRWLEHVGWVAFECCFLIKACLQSVAEMRGIAERRAQLEAAHELVERTVAERTEELAHSETRFHAFMDHSPAVTFMKDAEGRFVLVNRAFERTFAVSDAAVIGRRARDLWPEELASRIEDVDRRVLTEGESVDVIETLSGPGGAERRWNVYCFPVEAGGGRMVGGIALDVTEKLQLAERMRRAGRMEAVGRLAGGVAHDFNNLLTAVNGYAQLLVRALAADAGGLREYAQEIARAGERAAGLTRQLLAFSRRQIMQPRVLDLNAVVRDAEPLIRRLIGEDIRVTVVLDPALGRVKADPVQVEQVVLNLVLNARDAMPQGGRLTIETATVEMGPRAIGAEEAMTSGTYALLAVSDTGQGMDAETRARIFEPFFTTKEIGQGSGLGLSTVHGIVRQSGGEILVYSEPGMGTTFKAYLPVAAAAAEPGATPAGASGGGSETVLLVEDEDGVRHLVREVLARHGYDVVAARSGEEAVEWTKRHHGPIDILVTDVVMPGMGGRQLADRLVRLRPGLKVLFMSGYAEDAIVEHGVLEAGIEFLHKPFLPEAILARLREVLDRPRAA